MDEPRDIFDVLGDSVAAATTTQPERTPPLDSIRVGEITLVDAGSFAHPSCDKGRVPFGAGYPNRSEDFDWCSYCYVAELENPHRQPSGEEVRRLARHGMGSTGQPLHISVSDPAADLSLIQTLAEQHGIERLVVYPHPRLVDWLESGGQLPDQIAVFPAGAPGQMQSCDVASLKRKLSGTDEAPPLDPDLVARLEAAKDDLGIVRDPSLADEYHLALIRQSEQNDKRIGRPEPVIEQGRVFPSAGDADPLG